MALLKNARNLNKIGLGAKNGLNKAKSATKKAATSAKESSVGQFVSEKVQPTKLFVDAKTNDGRPKERLDNLYTGKRINPWIGGAAGAVWFGGSFTKASWEHEVFAPIRRASNHDVQEYGSPDIMMYDGVGQQRAPKNLNADGSIVFGLHNMRRG